MAGQEVNTGAIRNTAVDLRQARQRLLAGASEGSLQRRAVEALAQIAARWRDASFPIRCRAEDQNAAFPFAAVWQSLDALLPSFTQEALWELIDSEGARQMRGPELIGHVIAANTPLLAWTSFARALLVQSASLVKLPTHPVAAWAHYFRETLAEVDPQLASLIGLLSWKGGEILLDAAFCQVADTLVAYGDDQTMQALQSLVPASTPFIEYGHKVSFGLVLAGADSQPAAVGLSRDILLYDQGGCLSPHCVLVEGDHDDAVSFAKCLAAALGSACAKETFVDKSLVSDGARAAAVREARALARLEAGSQLWEDPQLLWTVIASPPCEFRLSPTFGIVYVSPLQGTSIQGLLAGVGGLLQGAAVAAGSRARFEQCRKTLEEGGVSYVCHPGDLQCPTLRWRQNGQDVLRLLGR